ncbi:ATP-binding protein [Bradyrhizobium sp. PMVTL-01]|uniref:ATP-binding protein n=1 Tax=unclassified Bradyrhizobium TaxID=2631580 RepID=UPI003F6FBD69
MTRNNGLIDATEYLRSVGAEAERLELTAIEVHAATPGNSLLLQSDRCWQLELIVNELLASAAARFAGRSGKIEIELSHEADLVHCTVTDNASESVRTVRGLDVARELAKGVCGRIGHWFDDETTSLVLTIPLTERERLANQPNRLPSAPAA